MVEDDYYSLLNLDRNCTDDDIKAAYKRQCMYYHPDKHSDANREAAENIFLKIKSAYEVLIDPKLRTIYDLYGVEGVEAGWHVSLADIDRNQIRETYERMLRQKKEKEQEISVNPVSHISIKMDASGLCYCNRDTYITELFNIPVNSFTIAQSVEAPLTERNKATIVCTAINDDDYATGLVQTSVRHSFSDESWIEPGFTFGHGATLSLRGYKRLTRYLFMGLRGQVSRIEPEYLQYSAGGEFGCNVDDSTTIKAEISFMNNTIKGVISKVWEKVSIYGSYEWGLENQELTLQIKRPIQISAPNDAHIMCRARYSLLFGGNLEYGVSKQLTEYSSLGATVKISHDYGVNLELMLTRGRHSYTFDIVFSDIIEPAAVVYGTCFPVFVYSAIHWLVVKPYLKRMKSEDIAAEAEENEAQLERTKEEAREAITLMKSSYERNLTSEQCKGGLVILQAWYGMFGTTNKLIDVTIPLQCLVSNSKLILPEQTKTGLVGFYDVCFGEENKRLAIKYRFRNNNHEVVISDEEPLQIPKKSHQMNGA